MLLLLFALALTACGKAAPTETVDSLVAHPDRLHEVERQCANHDPRVSASAAECEAASEARRRLFMGNGPRYTPSKTQPKF